MLFERKFTSAWCSGAACKSTELEDQGSIAGLDLNVSLRILMTFLKDIYVLDIFHIMNSKLNFKYALFFPFYKFYVNMIDFMICFLSVLYFSFDFGYL